MRHSRRAVMAERHKLYMKKNVFNSRYRIRNIEIGLCLLTLVALLIGGVVLAVTGSDTESEADVTGMKESVKEALFGNGEEVNSVTRESNLEEQINDEQTELAEDIPVQTSTSETNDTESVEVEEVASEEMTDRSIADVENASTETAIEAEAESEFDGKCIANVEESLNIRQEPSTDSEFVGLLNSGAIALVRGTEGDWTKIKSGDVEGYVLTDYILTGKSAEEYAKDYVTLVGTVMEDGVNVRTEQSTNADILTVLNKDDTISVLDFPTEDGVLEESEEITDVEEVANVEEVADVEEVAEEPEIVQNTEEVENTDVSNVTGSDKEEQTTENDSDTVLSENTVKDDITWVSVMLEDGQTGYVSADLVEIDKLYEIAVSAEELERREAEAEAARRAAEEEAARQAAAAANSSNSNNGAANQTSSGDNSGNDGSYNGAKTTPVTADASGDCLGTFTITAYCGCSKCSGGHNKTASGTTPTEGRTIAADTSILPFGTKVVIDGVVYTVEDCGSGVNGNHIDIFFATHERALAYGRRSVKVYRY